MDTLLRVGYETNLREGKIKELENKTITKLDYKYNGAECYFTFKCESGEIYRMTANDLGFHIRDISH